MRKATHPSGGVDSSNPCRWRGERLHHHDGGVCWIFVLLWIDSWCLKPIVCKKWHKNNLKMRLTALLFDPPRHTPHLLCLLAHNPNQYNLQTGGQSDLQTGQSALEKGSHCVNHFMFLIKHNIKHKSNWQCQQTRMGQELKLTIWTYQCTTLHSRTSTSIQRCYWTMRYWRCKWSPSKALDVAQHHPVWTTTIVVLINASVRWYTRMELHALPCSSNTGVSSPLTPRTFCG